MPLSACGWKIQVTTRVPRRLTVVPLIRVPRRLTVVKAHDWAVDQTADLFHTTHKPTTWVPP